MFDQKIPTPEELLHGPSYMNWRKKEKNKAIKEAIDTLKKSFTGQWYVEVSFWGIPRCVLEEVLEEFRQKGWKVTQPPDRKGPSHSYHFGLPSFEDLKEYQSGW